MKIFLRILFFKFRLFPEGRIKFDPKKYEKILKGEKDSPTSIIKEISRDAKDSGLVENIKNIARLISSFVKFCTPYMHVKLAKIHIKVASDDAAKTAILYGVISGAVAILIDTVDENTKLHKLKRKSVIIEPDFLSNKTAAKINVSLSISVFGAISTILKMIIKYQNIKIN